MLCWRDTAHPQGGGSETYLQRIGAELAASGIKVTLRCAAYPGAPRREVVDGVHISRAGGRFTVYPRALLSLLASRLGLGALRDVRPTSLSTRKTASPSSRARLRPRRWWCWCTTAIESSGRWQDRSSAGWAGGWNRACLLGCTGAISI
ncbi:Putative glycosyl transferase [Mycobacteroides abscessus]|nr:Putative glycosyl transferase [Mycobacteroides abscessus]